MPIDFQDITIIANPEQSRCVMVPEDIPKSFPSNSLPRPPLIGLRFSIGNGQ